MTAEEAPPSPADHALSIALQWAAEGFAVFPVEVFQQLDGTLGKVPRTAHGHSDATDDPGILAKLFAGLTPKHSGVIAVGMVPASNDVIVIDVDVKNGKDGLASFSKLGLRNDWSVRTPSGGFHVWLKSRMVFGNHSPWPGIDVRSGKGWVVAPGDYAPWASWELTHDRGAIPDLPQHIEDLLLSHRADDPSGDGDVRCITDGEPCRRMQGAIDGIRATAWTKDSRHDTMVKLQGLVVKLGDMGHPGAAEALRILREAFDQAKLNQTPGEWSRALTGAVSKYGGSTEEPYCDCGPLKDDPMFQHAVKEEADPRDDPHPPIELDKLWQASETLRHIHDAACSRNRSPMGVLVSCLAITSALTPHFVTLPSVVGSAGSVNLMVMLAAPPASGKSAIASIAHELFGMTPGAGVQRGDWLLRPILPGTGEGLVDVFLGKPDATGHRDFKARNGLLLVDEYSQMAAQSSRAGSTLLTIFRSMAHGESTGMSNADDSRTRYLPKNSYRMAAIMGVQPKLSHSMLTDAEIDGGTPQRFVWVDVRRKKGAPRAEWPGELPIAEELIGQLQDAVQGGSDLAIPEDVTIDYPQSIRAYVIAMDEDMEAIAALDRLKQHMVLLRLKLSVAVARLHGRFDHFTEWDWQVAGTVWHNHLQTLEWVMGELRRGNASANKAVGVMTAEREVARDEAKHRIAATSAERAITTRLQRLEASEWVSKKTIKSWVGSRHREGFETALDALLQSGQVEAKEGRSAGSKVFRWKQA